jgi:hypothetical protein
MTIETSREEIVNSRQKGLPKFFNTITEQLLLISEEEKDLAKKHEFFSFISQCLDDSIEDIENLLDRLESGEEMSDRIKEICKPIKENFHEAANLYFDAIELLGSFLETEDKNIIENARTQFYRGTIILQETGSIIGSFKSFLHFAEGDEPLEILIESDEI